MVLLRKNGQDGRTQVSLVSLDELVPKDHLVRKIENAIDFNFIYELVEDLYCEDNGRPSVKIALIQCIFGLRSMRQTIKEIETNVAYRWFIVYDFTHAAPHLSTQENNYIRRLKDTNLFATIFLRILDEAARHDSVHSDVLFIYATHVKANANKNKFVKEIIQEQPKKYQQLLEEE